MLLDAQARRGRRLDQVRRGVRVRAGGLQRPGLAGVVGQPLERDRGEAAVGEARGHEGEDGAELSVVDCADTGPARV